jgi:hypothetical protein
MKKWRIYMYLCNLCPAVGLENFHILVKDANLWQWIFSISDLIKTGPSIADKEYGSFASHFD